MADLSPIIGEIETDFVPVRGAFVLPPGGATGQVLGKLSNADYDVGWITNATPDLFTDLFTELFA